MMPYLQIQRNKKIIIPLHPNTPTHPHTQIKITCFYKMCKHLRFHMGHLLIYPPPPSLQLHKKFIVYTHQKEDRHTHTSQSFQSNPQTKKKEKGLNRTKIIIQPHPHHTHSQDRHSTLPRRLYFHSTTLLRRCPLFSSDPAFCSSSFFNPKLFRLEVLLPPPPPLLLLLLISYSLSRKG